MWHVHEFAELGVGDNAGSRIAVAPPGLPLVPVPRSVELVCLPRSAVCGRRSVAVDHLAVLPAGKADEVAFVASPGHPQVRERVAEAVRVDVADTGFGGAAFQHLGHTRGGHRPLPAQPQVGKVGVLGARADPEVPIEGLGGLGPVGHCPVAASLAKHEHGRGVAIHVLDGEPGKFTEANTSVEEQAKHGVVAAFLEPLARGDRQQRGDLRV